MDPLRHIKHKTLYSRAVKNQYYTQPYCIPASVNICTLKHPLGGHALTFELWPHQYFKKRLVSEGLTSLAQLLPPLLAQKHVLVTTHNSTIAHFDRNVNH